MARAQVSSDVFYAIADPTRRGIIDALRGGEQPAANLASRFDHTFSAISQHMRVLRDVGLVTVRKSGRERIYCLQAEPLASVGDWVRMYEPFWKSKLASLGKFLEEPDEN